MSPRRRILPIFVPHAGCPNNCVFCDQKRISGSLFPVSPEDVTRALDALAPGSGYELAFYGGSFTAIPVPEQEALLAAAGPAFRDGRISSVRISTRPDAVDEERLSLLKRYGVETVELGAQSMDGRVLSLSGRGHTPEDTVRAAGLVRAGGLRLILQMMTGLPGSGDASDIATAESVAALGPDGVRIYPTVILRGTALEELWRRGLYAEHTVEDAVRVCARILPVFSCAGIPVIRLGLNPSQELSGGAAVGGAYHPALGELAISRVLRNTAETLFSEKDRGADAVLGVSERRASAMIGQHRSNILWLTDRFSLSSLHVVPADVGDWEVVRF